MGTFANKIRKINAATEHELLAEVELCETYSRRLIDLKLCYEKVLNDQQEEASVDEARVASNLESVNRYLGRRKFCFPTIELKRYDRNVNDWLSFWDQFKKIHEDPNIDEYDRIEYLIQYTQ